MAKFEQHRKVQHTSYQASITLLNSPEEHLFVISYEIFWIFISMYLLLFLFNMVDLQY